MDFKGFVKYFKPKNIIPQIIGGFIVACGVILAIMGGLGLFMGLIIIAVGLAIIIFAREARPSDADVDEAVQKRTKDIEQDAMGEVDVHEKLVKAFAPVTFKEFDFSGQELDPDNFSMQRGSDGKYRTNRYSAAVILFAQEKLHIYMLRFFLTKDEEETNVLSQPYTELKEARTEKRTRSFVMYSGKNAKSVELEFMTIMIENNAGETIFEMPVHDSAEVDDTVETINRLIRSKKDGDVSFS